MARTDKRFEQITRLDAIRELDPDEFERFVAYLFRQRGYKVQVTPHSGDEGIDLWLRKKGKSAVVQCKHVKGMVGQPVVRDLFGVLGHTGAGEAYLVTSGRISSPARRWAAGKRIRLVDGQELVGWARKHAKPETSRAQGQTPTSSSEQTTEAWAGCIGLIFLIGACLAGIWAIDNLTPVDIWGEPNEDSQSAPVTTRSPDATPTPELLVTYEYPRYECEGYDEWTQERPPNKTISGYRSFQTWIVVTNETSFKTLEPMWRPDRWILTDGKTEWEETYAWEQGWKGFLEIFDPTRSDSGPGPGETAEWKFLCYPVPEGAWVKAAELTAWDQTYRVEFPKPSYEGEFNYTDCGD